MNQVEIIHKLVDEMKNKILRLDKHFNHDNLVFNHKDKNERGKTFNDFTDAVNLYENIKKSDMDLANVRKIKKNLNQNWLNKKGKTKIR